MTPEARGPDSPAGREAHDRHGGAATETLPGPDRGQMLPGPVWGGDHAAEDLGRDDQGLWCGDHNPAGIGQNDKDRGIGRGMPIQPPELRQVLGGDRP